MAICKNVDEKIIGKKMLLTTIKMEESLAELLRTELKILKKESKKDYNYEDIQNVNKTMKYILLSLTIELIKK